MPKPDPDNPASGEELCYTAWYAVTKGWRSDDSTCILFEKRFRRHRKSSKSIWSVQPLQTLTSSIYTRSCIYFCLYFTSVKRNSIYTYLETTVTWLADYTSFAWKKDICVVHNATLTEGNREHWGGLPDLVSVHACSLGAESDLRTFFLPYFSSLGRSLVLLSCSISLSFSRSTTQLNVQRRRAICLSDGANGPIQSIRR